MENSNVKRTKVKEEESWLNVPAVTKHTLNQKRTIGVGIDIGSTYSRIRQFDDEEGTIGENYEINSDIVLVDDISMIKSKNNTIYENLEVIIKDITDEKHKPDKIFITEHFVKCGLAEGKSGGKLERASQISKTKNKATYLNILTHIALEMYLHGNHVINSLYDIIPAIALPPEDFKSQKILDGFEESLAGTYEIDFPRLDLIMQLQINKDNIYLEKEPNAVQYCMASEDESLLEKTAITIDGGGKSTDLALMKSGRILDEFSKTLTYAGSRLKMDISEMYMQETGKSEPPKEAVEEALSDGVLVRGGRKEDIYEIIKKCKSAMADNIFNGILQVLDRAGMAVDDIETLTFHGRLFTETVHGDNFNESVNIDTLIRNKFDGLVADIEINRVVSTDCITQGVIISRWVELSA